MLLLNTASDLHASNTYARVTCMRAILNARDTSLQWVAWSPIVGQLLQTAALAEMVAPTQTFSLARATYIVFNVKHPGTHANP